MNKKEQAEMESLREQLRMAKAFRFTDAVEPDMPAPMTMSDQFSRGWDYWVNLGTSGANFRAEKACSSSIYHGDGWEKTRSRNRRSLYSTRLLALRAARHEMEGQAAKSLAQIDAAIEYEIANPSEAGYYSKERP